MKYVVLSFHLFEPNTLYQVDIDKGDGMKWLEIEYAGTFYPVFTKSPIKTVADYCSENDYEVMQVVEESGYKQLRFYLRKTGGTTMNE